MADDKPVTKKDLEGVIQKVTLQNAAEVKIVDPGAITEPLIKQQEKNDLKKLESDIEQRSLFESMYDGLQDIGDSIRDGMADLAEGFKTKGANVLKYIGIALGAAVGLLLAPVFLAVAFFKQLSTEIKFLNKLTKGKLAQIFKPATDFFDNIKNFFKNKFAKVVKGFDKVKKILGGAGKSSGVLGKFFGFLKKVGGVVKRIFRPLTKGFKQGFGVVTKFAKVAGRVLGKLFLPITILMSVFDFVKGFMRGYKEDGIIGGIKGGIISLLDGLFGSLIRMLMWIPTKLFEWMGLDNLAAGMMDGVNQLIEGIYGIIGGVVDLIVAIFTLDGSGIMDALMGIWSNVISVVLAPFNSLVGLLKDIFGPDFLTDLKAKFNIGKMIKKMFAKIKLFVADMFDWIPGLGGTLDKMKADAQQDLIDLEKPDPAPVVVIPSGGGSSSGGGDNISMNPTTIMVNDNNRSLAAQRRALAGGTDVDDW